MSKMKALLQSILSALGALLCIVIVVLMVCIMIAWTIGAVYVVFESGCTLEAGRFVCDLPQ